MKLIYTNENRYLVHNLQNILHNNGIQFMLKNEFAAGAAGDLIPHETWLELWVIDDSDYEHALNIIQSSFSSATDLAWICGQCQEQNDASFDFCWQCHSSK